MDQVEVLIETDASVLTFASEADADTWSLTGSPDPLDVRPAVRADLEDVQSMTAMLAASLT